MCDFSSIYHAFHYHHRHHLLHPFPTKNLPSLYLPPTPSTPRVHKAYKSRGDRLAPLGMSQPEARLKDSSPNIPSLSFQPVSRGNIYMKGTDPSHPGLKRGEERAVFTGSPRTVKGCDNRYFQGTKLLVIFGRRPLVGQNTTIDSIYIAASGLHKEWTIKVKCVFEFRRYNLEKRDVLLVRGETTAEGCCSVFGSLNLR